VTGPSVVAECGRGELVQALAATGSVASGVEPRRGLVGDALRDGLDVVVAAADAHLVAQVPGTLGAIVLVGVVDREPVGAQLALADHAVAALAPGGRLVVVVTHRDVWESAARAVEADLAPGHPLHPATWEAVLGHLGLVDVTTTACGDASVVVARRPAAVA
jgi:hypothetical protein